MTRLYIKTLIENEIAIALSDDQHHYVRNVLRFSIDDEIAIFNETGEWAAKITLLTKTKGVVIPINQMRPACSLTPLHLVFAPLKNDTTHFLVEKATELGVTHLHPVMTARANTKRVNEDKLLRIAIEATQQSERLEPPVVCELTPLRSFLQTWDANIPLICCKERGDRLPMGALLKTLQTPVAFLIGPEGGFSDEEFAYLETKAFVKFAGMGNLILRAETAALTALSSYHATLGSWS